MKDGKLTILFDASILSNGVNKDCNRSGIFFASLNIFKQFLLSSEFDMVLYCGNSSYANLAKFIDENFRDYKLKIYTDVPSDFITYLYFKLKEQKKIQKDKKNKFFTSILTIILLFLSPFVKALRCIKEFLLCFYDNYSNIDIFFSPVYGVPDNFKKNKSIKKYVLLYDLIPLLFPELFEKEVKWFNKLINSINKEEYYFAISESTKRDFLKYCPNIDKEKIHTALLACDERFKPESEERIKEIRKKYNIPEDKKYIFSLCTLEPRKNLKMAVKSFIEFIKKNKAEDIVYVLGGGHWEKFINELKEGEEKLGEYKEKIIRAGYIEDEDLMGLYTGAQWFVYTSKYEGFGLPPLEAMSCGCPVITSNNSSLPEVVADAGIMIDYDSEEEHIEAYEKFYYNEEERKEYKRRGLERAREFSWKKCADIIINELTKEDKIHD